MTSPSNTSHIKKYHTTCRQCEQCSHFMYTCMKLRSRVVIKSCAPTKADVQELCVVNTLRDRMLSQSCKFQRKRLRTKTFICCGTMPIGAHISQPRGLYRTRVRLVCACRTYHRVEVSLLRCESLGCAHLLRHSSGTILQLHSSRQVAHHVDVRKRESHPHIRPDKHHQATVERCGS